CARSDGSMDYW
nr:immunoglobulin heavy chain junction region [Mus musculus]